MHILHWIAVEAENEEQASNRVKDILEDGSVARWSDYYQVGFDDNPGAISFNEQPDKVYNLISSAISHRQNEIIKLTQRMRDSPVKLLEKALEHFLKERVVPNPFLVEVPYTDMEIYMLEKIVALLNDTYIPESCFFDAVAFTAGTNELENRILKEPEKQYLVAVRFHV